MEAPPGQGLDGHLGAVLQAVDARRPPTGVGGARLRRDPLGFDWTGFNHAGMLRAKVGLEGQESPASLNLSLVALRGVAEAAWQLRLHALDELERLRSVRCFRHDVEAGKGRFVPRSDRSRLFRFEGFILWLPLATGP
jgi:hypothetical protein